MTENSSKSSNNSSYDALRTCYQEKPKDYQNARKKYGTDLAEIKERESKKSSQKSFDSDLELDSDN